MTARPILHDYFRSSAAYRVRIALNLKGVAAERRFVHLRKSEQRAPAYLEVNPQGLVPTLVVGDRVNVRTVNTTGQDAYWPTTPITITSSNTGSAQWPLSLTVPLHFLPR